MAALWTHHVTKEGRPYWSNSQTKQSVWEKPFELKTPAEQEIERTTKWKEYETKGRKYWVNSETKVNTWEIPQQVQDIINKHAPPQVQQQQQQQQIQHNQQQMKQMQTSEHAVQAFIALLKKRGVDPSWTWEQVLTETVTTTAYKAIKTLAERKAIFAHFVQEIKDEQARAREESLKKSRKEFHRWMDKMGTPSLADDNGASPMVQPHWTWAQARPLLQRWLPDDVWGLPADDGEREALFEEYVSALRARREREAREFRDRCREKLTAVLRSLDLNLAGPTRWRDVRHEIVHSAAFEADEDLRDVPDIEILRVYEEELGLALDAQAAERTARATQRRRDGRKAREAFAALLAELVAAGTLRAGTKWKDIYPEISAHPAYETLLAYPAGSQPLDLFFDAVDELDRALEGRVKAVESYVRDSERNGAAETSAETAETPTDAGPIRVTEETTLDEFAARVAPGNFDSEAVAACFRRLHTAAVHRAKDDRRRREREVRGQVEALRVAIRDLEPPVKLSATYEDVVERLAELPAFVALKNDPEAQRSAFDRFLKREKEKEHELSRREREKERDKDHEHGRREREKERDPTKHDQHRKRHHRSPPFSSGGREAPVEPLRPRTVYDDDDKIASGPTDLMDDNLGSASKRLRTE